MANVAHREKDTYFDKCYADVMCNVIKTSKLAQMMMILTVAKYCCKLCDVGKSHGYYYNVINIFGHFQKIDCQNCLQKRTRNSLTRALSELSSSAIRTYAVNETPRAEPPCK